jgi:hypothetical protein
MVDREWLTMPGARFRIRTFMILTASLTLMLSTVRSLAFTHELADLPFLALLYVAIVILSSLSAILESIKRGLGWLRMVARYRAKRDFSARTVKSSQSGEPERI